MARFNILQRVSQPPTNPHPPAAPRTFDVADLYRGPVTESAMGPEQAWLWMKSCARPISGLLTRPLPADLINAQKLDDIRISWRKWLTMRVKIIDEYNRIPTRTQSALLTVMGDNYAEILDHIYECPESAWFLTANDEQAAERTRSSRRCGVAGSD